MKGGVVFNKGKEGAKLELPCYSDCGLLRIHQRQRQASNSQLQKYWIVLVHMSDHCCVKLIPHDFFLSKESRQPDRDAVGAHELGAERGLLARQRALRLGLLGPHRQGLGDGHQAVRPHILRALGPGTY